MLCQLVCVDRRYQRMNCFNIRELQGILKRKFFPDLINNSDHHLLMESSMIGLRFKTNSNEVIRPEQSLFYNFGISNLSKQKNLNLIPYIGNSNGAGDYLSPTFSTTVLSSIRKLLLSESSFSFLKHNNILSFIKSHLPLIFMEVLTLLKLNLIYAIMSLKYLLNQLLYIIIHNFNFSFVLGGNTENFTTYFKTILSGPVTNFRYFSDNLNNQTDNLSKLSSFSDTSNSVRFNKFNNILIGYDYKSGHYLSIWDQLYPSLITSFIEVSRGIRKAPWFYSDQFTDLLKTSYSNFYTKFTTPLNLKLAEIDN